MICQKDNLTLIMKTLILFLFLIAADTVRVPSTTVYICSGAKGKKYHLRADCRGLSHCTHRVVKMKLSDAEKEGRTLCGFEK
jgi:hypothetical protein